MRNISNNYHFLGEIVGDKGDGKAVYLKIA